MAYTGTLTTEAEIAAMAGENVDATGATEANRNAWTIQVQGYLTLLSKYDWVANYASLDANIKGVLSEYCARYVAVCEIAFNMAGFTTRIEAEDMLNIHMARMAMIEKLLSDQSYLTWMKNL